MIGAGRETPSPGDVVTFSSDGFDFIGRIVRTADGWATVQLDSGETVRARLFTVTVVDRYVGPRANVQRCDGGWRLSEVRP